MNRSINHFGQSPTTGATTMESVTGAISPKSLSPIEERMERLTSAQDGTYQMLSHLLARLSPVLRDASPVAEGRADSATALPPSPLANELDGRVSSAQGINARITDILERLTL